MRNGGIWTAALLASMLFAGGDLLADDVRVAVPEGWSGSAVQDVLGGHFVAALDSEAGGGHSLLIHRLGATEFVDLPGRVESLRLSPDGGLVLANLRLPAAGETRPCHGDGAALVSTEGRVHWTKREPFAFAFSTTGQSILAWQPGGECAAGSQVQVYGLRGGFRGLYDAGVPVESALALGSGERVVLALADRLVCIDFSEGATIAWSLEHASPARMLRAAGPDRLVEERGGGAFRLIDGSGGVRYAFDPERIAAGDPGRSAEDYARFRAFPSPRGGDLLLFDGSSRGFRVDPDTGVLVEVRFNADPPAGFARTHDVRNSHFIFEGDGAFVVRPVSTKEE